MSVFTRVSCVMSDRKKLTIRITELTNMLDAANVKIGGLNKTKDKLTNEIRELTIEIDNISGKR